MLTLIHMGIGFVIGAFTPSVGRKIKALFVEYGGQVKDKAKL